MLDANKHVVNSLVLSAVCGVTVCAEAGSVTVGLNEQLLLDGSDGDITNVVAAGNGSQTTVVGNQLIENAIVTNAATMNLGPNGQINRVSVGLSGTFNQAGGRVGRLAAVSSTPTINIAGGRVDELVLANGNPTINIGGGDIGSIKLGAGLSTVNVFADSLTGISVNGLPLPGESGSGLFEPFDLVLGDPLVIDGEILAFIVGSALGLDLLGAVPPGQPLPVLDTVVFDVLFPGDLAESLVFDFGGSELLSQAPLIIFDNSAGFPGPRVIGGAAAVPAPAAAGAGLMGLVLLVGRRRRSAV